MILTWIRRRGAQKVGATQIVNEAEPLLQQSLEAFQAGPQTEAAKAEALHSFDALWAFVSQECSSPGGTYKAFGDAGRRCVDERRQGGQWDWFAAYRLPIEQAQVVRNGAAGLFAGADGGGGISLLPLAAVAALVVGAAVV
jgi:hypothetical protein